MPSVPITELKAQLAKYLRMAQRGTEVQVLERGVPIARIVGMPKPSESESAGLERLVRSGLVRRGQGKIEALVPRRIVANANVQQALDEDREDRT